MILTEYSPPPGCGGLSKFSGTRVFLYLMGDYLPGKDLVGHWKRPRQAYIQLPHIRLRLSMEILFARLKKLQSRRSEGTRVFKY